MHAPRRPRRTLTARVTPSRLVVPLLAALAAGCGGGGGAPPTAADLPAILDEAAGKRSVPRFGDAGARRAVREALKRIIAMDDRYAAEIARRMQRAELDEYLLQDHSYVGETFPRKTAELLREVDDLERQYVDELATFPDVLGEELRRADVPDATAQGLVREMGEAFTAHRQARVEALGAHRTFLQEAAVLYELAASESASIRSMRDGLEITDASLAASFNRQVDAVNAAAAATDAAIRQLGPDDQRELLRMAIAKRL